MSDQAYAKVQAQQKTLSESSPKSSLLQRTCACGQHTLAGGECVECRKKREGTLQRAAISAPPVGGVPPIVHEVLRSPGQPPDAATRAFMEPRFGHDFSGVRVHNDARAAESARAVNALAYTVGRDIVFGAGQYQPQTEQGRHLIAHELTHTIQQRAGAERVSGVLETTSPEDASEREADAEASAIMEDKRFTPTMEQGQEVALQPAPDAGGAPDGGAAPAPGGPGPGSPPPAPAPGGGGPAPAPAPVVTDITVANQADAITYPEPSVLGAAGRKHFVTVAGSGPDVIVEATTTGGAPAPGSIAWTGVTPDPGNPARATVPRSLAGKREVTASAGGGSASLTVWAVFASIRRVNGPTLGHTPPTGLGALGRLLNLFFPVPAPAGTNCAGSDLCVWATINNDAEIFPKQIINDPDRPNLAGARTVAPPGGAHPCGGGLGGGAPLRWDFSRQVNVAFGGLLAGGACANAGFPANNAEGNDDTHAADEMNNPYTGGAIAVGGRAVAAGFVGDTDVPSFGMRDATGVPGDTATVTANFREFVRLEYHGTWWLASHRPTWGVDLRLRKNAANHWVDDGSTVT